MQFDSNMAFQIVDSDEIGPYKIDHGVDEIYNNGRLEQKYNFVVYHFKFENGYMKARTYLDSIETVSLYGPFKSEDVHEAIEGGSLFSKVVSYMSRRFYFIEVLGEEGYEIIWQVKPCTE